MFECQQHKHTQHAPSTKKGCDYLSGWIKKQSCAHKKNHQRITKPLRSSRECKSIHVGVLWPSVVGREHSGADQHVHGPCPLEDVSFCPGLCEGSRWEQHCAEGGIQRLHHLPHQCWSPATRDYEGQRWYYCEVMILKTLWEAIGGDMSGFRFSNVLYLYRLSFLSFLSLSLYLSFSLSLSHSLTLTLFVSFSLFFIFHFPLYTFSWSVPVLSPHFLSFLFLPCSCL